MIATSADIIFRRYAIIFRLFRFHSCHDGAGVTRKICRRSAGAGSALMTARHSASARQARTRRASVLRGGQQREEAAPQAAGREA
jgi:hypothetical protein